MLEQADADERPVWAAADEDIPGRLLSCREVAADLRAAQRQFRDTGFAIVTSLLPPSFYEAISAEARALVAAHGVRRDFRMAASGGTPRRMQNVQQTKIRAHGSVIPGIYSALALRDLLSEIAGEQVFTCPYDAEKYVITCLEEVGDTHGWHWDDYSFALVWVIETPPPEKGGFIQCVANTRWNRQGPNLVEVLSTSSIQSYPVGSGQAYFLRSDTTLHRVYPLVERSRRMIVNMAFASTVNLGQEFDHETVDRLWSAPADESASPAPEAMHAAGTTE